MVCRGTTEVIGKFGGNKNRDIFISHSKNPVDQTNLFGAISWQIWQFEDTTPDKHFLEMIENGFNGITILL